MNAPTAICPQCQKQVSFIKDAENARCPECGFQYRLEPPRIDSYGYAVEPPGWKVALKALALVFLIMVGIVVVGTAVLFAGCAMAMRGI